MAEGPDPLGFVTELRKAGTTATGCNIHIRSLNAFFRWAGQPPMRKLKEEEKIPPTLSQTDIQKLLKLNALIEQGEYAFSRHLAITTEGIIIDG